MNGRLFHECRGASKPEKLLDEDDFSFLKNDCAVEKWVAVELSLRIRVSSVQLVMLELYSSRVKDFQVYGAPTKAVAQVPAPWEQPPWELLGMFKAQNKKGPQVRLACCMLCCQQIDLAFSWCYGQSKVPYAQLVHSESMCIL
jgi:hypothetical protein